MSQEKLQTILDQFPDKRFQQAALELLIRESNIYSSRRLAYLARKQHQNILKTAERLGIAQEDIYYLVSGSEKSYVDATHRYCIANEVPANKVITDTRQIKPSSRKPLVVVLDDVGGTGQTLLDQVYAIEIRGNNYDGHVLLAPTVATRRCTMLMNEIIKGNQKKGAPPEKNLLYLPGEAVQEFTHSRYYQRLNEAQKRVFKMLLGDLGFGVGSDVGTGLCMAFPYMSPDGNNSFFAANIASSYTLNGNGVKGRDNWHISSLTWSE